MPSSLTKGSPGVTASESPVTQKQRASRSGGARLARLLLRFGLRVVTLGPLGENPLAVLGRPGEVVLHQQLLVIRGHIRERLGHTRNRDDRVIRGVELARLLRR